MDVVEQIASLLADTFKSRDLNLDSESILKLIETPKDSSHGDYAFPCFSLAKQLRNAPPKIAQSLLDDLQVQVEQNPALEKVVAMGPYLNFFQAAGSMANIVTDILEGKTLNPEPENGERVMIEYSQPNTHKAFHVGHMRNVALGDSLVRIYE